MDNEFMIDYKKQNKKGKVLIIIFLVLLLLVFGYFGGNFFIKKFDSKLVFINFFDDVFDKIDDTIYSYSDKFEDSNIQVDSKIDLSFGIEEQLDLNNIGLNSILQLDKNNNKLFIDYKYLENEESLANFQLLYNNQDLYLSFYELFDKVLKLNFLTEEEKDVFNMVNEIDEKVKVDNKDIERLLELTKKLIVGNINDDKFVRSKEEVLIDGIGYNLDKHAYVFNGNEHQEFIVNVLNDIRNNEEYINLLVKVFGLNKDNFINELDELILSEKEIVVNLNVEYVIYTNGLFREIVGFGVLSTDIEWNNSLKVKCFNIDDRYLFLVSDEYEDSDIEDYYYKIEGKKYGDLIKLTYEENNELISNITYKSVGNSIELVFSEPLDEYAFKICFSSLNENDLLSFNFSLEYIYDEINMKLSINNKIIPIDEILEFNYNDTVDFDNLTEEDILKIQNNMIKILENSKVFNNLFGNYDLTDESLVIF